MDHNLPYKHQLMKCIEEGDVFGMGKLCDPALNSAIPDLTVKTWQGMAIYAVGCSSLTVLERLLETQGDKILAEPKVINRLCTGLSYRLMSQDLVARDVLRILVQRQIFPNNKLLKEMFRRGVKGHCATLHWFLDQGIPANLTWMQRGNRLTKAVKKVVLGIGELNFLYLESILAKLNQIDPNITKGIAKDEKLISELWWQFINLKYKQTPDGLWKLGLLPPVIMNPHLVYEFTSVNRTANNQIKGWIMATGNTIQWAPNFEGINEFKLKLHELPEHRNQFNQDIRNNQNLLLDETIHLSTLLTGQLVEAGFDFDYRDQQGNTFFHRLFSDKDVQIPPVLQSWIDNHPEKLLDTVNNQGKNCFNQEAWKNIVVTIIGDSQNQEISLELYQSRLKKIVLGQLVEIKIKPDKTTPKNQLRI